jgi:hypothetical protein
MVAGDTHGDMIISQEIVKEFFRQNCDYLVFLGDYIDRTPADINNSMMNIDFLLQTKLANPKKIFLLKGNHETHYAIPFFPHDFMHTAKDLYDHYIAVFREMPLMGILNNVFVSHAGFLLQQDITRIDKNDSDAITPITWSEPEQAPVFRGIGTCFTKKTLATFLEAIQAIGFIRGHDPHLNGIIVYTTCLTIFSSRVYKHMGNGGILIVILSEDIHRFKDITIKTFDNGTWKTYTPHYL